MRAKHLREWLREHRVTEELWTDEGGEEGAEREKSKWEFVVDMI